MRKSRRLVIPLAAFALLAGVGLTAGLSLVAHAQTEIATCPSEGTPISCTISSPAENTTVSDPASIEAVLTLASDDTATNQYVAVTYSVFCTQGNDTATTTNATAELPAEQAIAAGSPVTDDLQLGFTNPDTCEVQTLSAELDVSDSSSASGFAPATTGNFAMELEWTPQTASSTSAASEPEISGYDGKCLDDTGNSTADRTKIQLWTCNGDGAQNWTLSSNGELQHNGDCANDRGFGGNNSKVILWTCNGANNEIWTPESNGELISSVTGHGILCLDDPGYSTSNGTQLIVYTCHNGSNQHWSVTSS